MPRKSTCMDIFAEAAKGVMTMRRTSYRWIPCSKRLPRKSGWYYITLEYKGGRIMEPALFFENSHTWESTNSSLKVIAWMPWPKVYEGEE